MIHRILIMLVVMYSSTWTNAQPFKDINLQNEFLSVRIKLKGAELTSLKDLQTNIEYLWQGDPVHWSRQSPILFPIIGSLKDDEFIYDGNVYKLSQHGFAMDKEFKVVDQKDTSVLLSIKSNENTLKAYPFKFELMVSYELVGRSLKVLYHVINLDNKEMFFSIGGHPGFNCPLRFGEKRSEYQLVFDQKENASIHLRQGRLRSGDTEVFLTNENTITIVDDLFKRGALIFTALKSRSIQLKRGKERLLTLHFNGFPNLGIWSSSATAPFVCIEPWFGMTDPIYTNKDIMEKEGIVRLSVQEKFNASYTIEL